MYWISLIRISTIDEYADTIGASPTIFRNQKQIDQRRAQRAQQQQIAQQQALAQAQAETQQKQANTIKTVGETDAEALGNLAIEGGIV